MCIRFIRKTAGTDKASHPSNNVAIYIENTVFLPNVSLGNNLINNSFGGRVDVHSQTPLAIIGPAVAQKRPTIYDYRGAIY